MRYEVIDALANKDIKSLFSRSVTRDPIDLEESPSEQLQEKEKPTMEVTAKVPIQMD